MNKSTIKSQEVAKILQIPHKELIEGIQGCIELLQMNQKNSEEFFIKRGIPKSYGPPDWYYDITYSGRDFLIDMLLGVDKDAIKKAFIELEGGVSND